MTLRELLFADLARQYFYEGSEERKPSVLGVVKRSLHPRFMPVVLCRLTQAIYRSPLRPLARIPSLLNFVLFGIEIGMQCEMGPGLYFPHTVGTVIGALRIGRNAIIYQNVTLGAKEVDLGYSAEQRPVIGNNVIVGSGAKVLGGITIGDNVTIGANAVVIRSVPDGAVVGGIPARILKQSDQEAG